MDQQLVQAVAARAGIAPSAAEEAIRAMVTFIEDRLPVGIAAHVSRVSGVEAQDADDEEEDEAGPTTQRFSAVIADLPPDA